MLLTGPTGIGKSYLAYALAQKACREGYTSVYVRFSRLFQDISLSKGDGHYNKQLAGLAKTGLLALDDRGLANFTQEQCRDLLETIEDRHGLRSPLITSQLPVKHWHDIMGTLTLADDIVDHLGHNAYKINLKVGSLRKQKKKHNS